MDVQIIYEDNDSLVIEKPSGMVVNRSETTKEIPTIQDWAEKYLKVDWKDKKYAMDTFESRSGVVHRIDKETSGLLILAKNSTAFANLQEQFKKGQVEKVYTALCYGKVLPEQGTVNAPIGRLPWNRMRFGIIPMGRLSQTDYRVIDYYKRITNEDILTLIEAYPKTGRTHQIRVHMQYLGFSLFADPLYGGRKIVKKDRKILNRHFLHASKISFYHPTTGELKTFESDLPADLKDVLTSLQRLK